MNVEQLKKQYGLGDLVCYIKISDKHIKNKPANFEHYQLRKIPYKLIHKKHSHIADAVIENPELEVWVDNIEQTIDRWGGSYKVVDFFKSYEPNADYRLKPQGEVDVHYKIVRDDCISGLADKVNSNIKAGFICQGGVSIIQHCRVDIYIQAMTYKKEDK